MDFRSLLQSMTELSESEGSRVHKGTYGTSHGKEDVRDQYGHKIGKVNKDAEGKKDAPKKGRGRPKKGADDSGEVKTYDSSALSNVFGGGKKPKGEVGKRSVKHSLKEYMESVADTKEAEAVMEGLFGGVDHTSVAANLSKLAKVIKSVQTPEQFAVAQKYAQRMKGTIMNHQHDKMGFGSGLRANLGVMRDVDADLKAKAAELGIEYNAIEEDMTNQDPIQVKPASQTNTQVIQKGNQTLGTVNNPQLAAQIKQSIGKGEMTLNPNDEQQMAEGKKPDFTDVDDDDNETESWTKAEKDKEAKKKVAESRDHEASEYLDEKIAKILAREKPGMEALSSNDEFYGAIYHELIACGLTPKAARYKVSYDEDFISDVASAYAHYQKVPSLDEGSIEDHTQHGMDATPSKYVAVDPKQAPTPWSVDPIQATTDRAINFISGLRKPKPEANPFSEGTNMKDIQVESWAKQLDSLLNEGITVSSSTGQQGSPDSVTISATDADAGQLLGVLRNAGIGVFGGEEKPQIGYGVASQGEEDFDGTGTEPQAAPDVVGDGDDMLSLMKRMAGIEGGEQGSPEQGGEEQSQTLEPAQGGEEGGQDYEDENSSDTSSDEEGAEEGGEEQDSQEDEEEVDEANDGNLANNAKPYDKVTQGDVVAGRLGKDEEGGHADHDESCSDCGQSECECEEETVEESFANEPHDEIAQLKALLSMGNDLNREKHSQAVGNPVRAEISDWKKLSGI